MKLVTIASFFNPADAQLVRSQLEAADFHPFVAHEIAALGLEGYGLAAGGILVQVPEEEVESAKEFLKDGVPLQSEDDHEDKDPSGDVP